MPVVFTSSDDFITQNFWWNLWFPSEFRNQLRRSEDTIRSTVFESAQFDRRVREVCDREYTDRMKSLVDEKSKVDREIREGRLRLEADRTSLATDTRTELRRQLQDLSSESGISAKTDAYFEGLNRRYDAHEQRSSNMIQTQVQREVDKQLVEIREENKKLRAGLDNQIRLSALGWVLGGTGVVMLLSRM
jgi:hypothetical protein